MNAVFSNVTGTPATPQFFEVVLRGVFNPGGAQLPIQIVNVLHFARVTGPGVMTASDLWGVIESAMETVIEAAMVNTMSYFQADVRPMDDPTIGFTPITIAWVGTNGADAQPGFATVTIRKKSAGRGRNYRGSIHFAGLSEDDTDGNVLDASGVTLWEDVETVMSGWTSPFAVGGGGDECQLCILSPTLSNLSANPCIFSGALCNAVALNTTIGTMRRRKMGVGV